MKEEGGEMRSERLEMRNEGGRKKFANTRKWNYKISWKSERK